MARPYRVTDAELANVMEKLHSFTTMELLPVLEKTIETTASETSIRARLIKFSRTTDPVTKALAISRVKLGKVVRYTATHEQCERIRSGALVFDRKKNVKHTSNEQVIKSKLWGNKIKGEPGEIVYMRAF